MPDTAEYKVQLENYYGPLDLLLHLVKETEVDITRITLARACEQYITFLKTMEKLDIELSGNFLSLASQLLLLKARAVAPPELAPAEGDELDGEEDEGEASLELIRKLLDYKRFKDRARALDVLMTERSRRFGRPHVRLEGETEVEPLRNLELWDLVLLYSNAIKGIRLEARLSILYRDIPLEVFIDRILRSLADKTVTSYSELLGTEAADRTLRMGTFLALLQLAKSQKVRVEQEADFADIRVEAVPESERPEEAATVPDLAAIEAMKKAAAPTPPSAPEPAAGAYAYSMDKPEVPAILKDVPPEPPPAPETPTPGGA
jgi:segregation and condensation protein A